MADQQQPDTDDSDSNSEDEINEVGRNQEDQNSDLEHFARMYVLRQENVYLERQAQLDRNLLQSEVDKNSKIKQEIKQKQRELSQLKKAKTKREKLEHIQNRREIDFITGSFRMFWRSLEANEVHEAKEEAKRRDVFGLPGFSLEKFLNPNQ